MLNGEDGKKTSVADTALSVTDLNPHCLLRLSGTVRVAVFLSPFSDYSETKPCARPAKD